VTSFSEHQAELEDILNEISVNEMMDVDEEVSKGLVREFLMKLKSNQSAGRRTRRRRKTRRRSTHKRKHKRV
jgi:hypothetical protein